MKTNILFTTKKQVINDANITKLTTTHVITKHNNDKKNL